MNRLLAPCSPVCRYHAKQMVQQRHRLATWQWHAWCHVGHNDAERCLVQWRVNARAEQCLQLQTQRSARTMSSLNSHVLCNYSDLYAKSGAFASVSSMQAAAGHEIQRSPSNMSTACALPARWGTGSPKQDLALAAQPILLLSWRPLRLSWQGGLPAPCELGGLRESDIQFSLQLAHAERS